MCFMCSATQVFDPLRHPGEGPDSINVTEGTDARADTGTIYTMSVGDTFSGTISSAYEEDWVAITLTAGTTYSITNTGGTLSDPQLGVYNSTGTSRLAWNDDGGPGLDSALTFTATTTGTYYISGEAYQAHTGSYQISVQEVAPPEPAPVATLDELADFLTNGYWEGTNRTARSFDTSGDNIISVNISGLTAAGQQLARWSFEAWELVADIEFVETFSTNADITFDDNDSGAYASSTVSNGNVLSSTINVSTNWLATSGTTLDSYSFQTYVHEIGHALGLGHQGGYNGSARYGTDETFSNDSWQMSIMSYFSQTENTTTTASYAALLGPMMSDIVAIQNLYGASTVTAGDTVWGQGSNLPGYLGDFFNQTLSSSAYGGGPVAYTIFDQGGIDHINAANSTDNNRFDLRETYFSDVGGLINNVGIARGTLIEHLTTGTGNDTIMGNYAGNRIISGGGNDSIQAQNGWDTVWGEAGDDTIYGGNGNDRLGGQTGRDQLWGEEGNDTLIGGGWGDTLGGGNGNDSLLGGLGADVMWGGNGVDTMYGGEGADTLGGGNNDDRLFGEDGFDVLGGGFGNDYIDGGNQNDTLDGFSGRDTLLGGNHNDDLRGGAWADTLYGGNGNDTLSGDEGNDLMRGDAGNDVIFMGAGNDTAFGGANADTFVFGRFAGVDVIADFSVSEGDRIRLNDNLWTGTLTDAQVISQFGGQTVGGDFRLAFANGEVLIFDGVSTSAGLANLIDIF